MGTRTFTLTASVDVSSEEAIDFLMQLDSHRGMHPYLQSATVVRAGSDVDGPWWDWDVVERPRLGPLRYRIRFPARMSRLAGGAMRGRVRAAPGCHLETTTTAVPVNGRTQITENTVVRAPSLLVGYMTKHARLAHAQTLQLLPAELRQAHSGS